MSAPIAFSTFSPSTSQDYPEVEDATVQVQHGDVQVGFDFSVNPDILEQEWVSLPLSVFNASKMLADDRFCHEELKRQAEVVRSDVEMEVRRHPAKFDLDKVTDNSAKAMVNIDARVQDADRRVLEARRNLDTASAVVAAMTAKKEALNAITEMKKMNFYNTR